MPGYPGLPAACLSSHSERARMSGHRATLLHTHQPLSQVSTLFSSTFSMDLQALYQLQGVTWQRGLWLHILLGDTARPSPAPTHTRAPDICPVPSASCSKSLTPALLGAGPLASLPNRGANSTSTQSGSRVPGNPASPGHLFMPIHLLGSQKEQPPPQGRDAAEAGLPHGRAAGDRLGAQAAHHAGSAQGPPHGPGASTAGATPSAGTCCLGCPFGVHRAASGTNQQVEGPGGGQPEAV